MRKIRIQRSRRSTAKTLINLAQVITVCTKIAIAPIEEKNRQYMAEHRAEKIKRDAEVAEMRRVKLSNDLVLLEMERARLVHELKMRNLETPAFRDYQELPDPNVPPLAGTSLDGLSITRAAKQRKDSEVAIYRHAKLCLEADIQECKIALKKHELHQAGVFQDESFTPKDY